ncbi:MAG TPA: thiamine pyrophosphate-binding protein [Gaiellaceae bacterium]|nr:thiamine pyrophosphate-binding protein [Gaiellaceae bacterium]
MRVGSATDGRAPVAVVERSLAAGPFHWLGLAAVALAALVADQVTKQIVVNQLPLGDSIHVAGPGIENAFGGVAQAHGDSTPILMLPGQAAREPTSATPARKRSSRSPAAAGGTAMVAR